MNVRDQFAYYSLQCLCPNQVSKADGQGGAWGGSREAQGPGAAPPGRGAASHTLLIGFLQTLERTLSAPGPWRPLGSSSAWCSFGEACHFILTLSDDSMMSRRWALGIILPILERPCSFSLEAWNFKTLDRY